VQQTQTRPTQDNAAAEERELTLGGAAYQSGIADKSDTMEVAARKYMEAFAKAIDPQAIAERFAKAYPGVAPTLDDETFLPSLVRALSNHVDPNTGSVIEHPYIR